MTGFNLKTEIKSIETELNLIRDGMLSWQEEYPELADAAGYVEELAARLREPVLDSGTPLFLESVIAQADQVMAILIKRGSDFPSLNDCASDLESAVARLRGLRIAIAEVSP